MPGQHLQLLGSVQVSWEKGSPPRFRSQRTAALLGYLAAEARPFTRDFLAALLWPDEDRGKGKANLRRELHNLARILPGSWQTSRVEVEFVPGEGTTVDIYEFRQYETAGQWQEAAELTGGNFLEGIVLSDNLEFETWLLGEQERWRQRCSTIVSRLMARDIVRGEYEAAIMNGRRLLHLSPWHEETHRRVILLLARTGERAEALKQYDLCRQQMAEHLAVEPEMATQTLYQTILKTQDEAVLKERLSDELARHQPPHNLPHAVTRFLGRSDDLDSLHERLSQPEIRLVTLSGPGGVGKTRLALEAARLNLHNYGDGAFFVDLASLVDPALVEARIAEELPFAPHANAPVIEQLQAYLHDKQMLLILDNFEHLLAAASVVSTLLRAAPGLTVLATSRAPLRLAGEWDFAVDPLRLPVGGQRVPVEQLMANEGVQLFCERAVAVKPAFELTEENAAAVAEICIKLDGLPLAIELVAARSRLLSPAQILAQWRSGIQLSSQGTRDLPERQQTLQATLDWSYNLLEVEEQELFRRLAPFAGGFTLEAAEAVCSLPGKPPVLACLEALLDNNMITETERGNEARFRMLIPVREYALGLLSSRDEQQDSHRRHAGYFTTLAETAQPNFFNKDQVTWLNKLENEQDNLRAALAWSFENDLEVNLRLACALGRYWHLKGHLQEGRNWLGQALDNKVSDNYPGLRARALNEYGLLARFLGDYETARLSLTQSVSVWRKLDDKVGLAHALCDLGACLTDNLPAARSHLEESIELFKRFEDDQGLARSFFWHSFFCYLQDDYVTAEASAQKCIQITREIGDTSNLAAGISVLGRIAFQQRRFNEAERHFANSEDLFRQAEDMVGEAIVLACQMILAYVQNKNEKAITYAEETLEICQKIDDRIGIAEAHYFLGMAAYQQGDLERARHNISESFQKFRQLGIDLEVAHCLFALAMVTIKEHQAEQAARLMGAAEVTLEKVHLTVEEFIEGEKPGRVFEPLTAVLRTEYTQAMSAAQEALDPERFGELWQEGRKMPAAQLALAKTSVRH